MAGRPRAADTRGRTRELLRLLVDGKPIAEAATLARVKPERVLRLLDEPGFRQAYDAIRAGDLGPTAVVLEDPFEAAA